VQWAKRRPFYAQPPRLTELVSKLKNTSLGLHLEREGRLEPRGRLGGALYHLWFWAHRLDRDSRSVA